MEIKAILESAKVDKAVKESLLNLGKKRDKEYQKLDSKFSSLKKGYDKKIKELGVCIVETQKNRKELHKKQLHGNLKEKIDKLQKSLMVFKS